MFQIPNLCQEFEAWPRPYQTQDREGEKLLCNQEQFCPWDKIFKLYISFSINNNNRLWAISKVTASFEQSPTTSLSVNLSHRLTPVGWQTYWPLCVSTLKVRRLRLAQTQQSRFGFLRGPPSEHLAQIHESRAARTGRRGCREAACCHLRGIRAGVTAQSCCIQGKPAGWPSRLFSQAVWQKERYWYRCTFFYCWLSNKD